MPKTEKDSFNGYKMGQKSTDLSEETTQGPQKDPFSARIFGAFVRFQNVSKRRLNNALCVRGDLPCLPDRISPCL
jgi:hypothetical protein